MSRIRMIAVCASALAGASLSYGQETSFDVKVVGMEPQVEYQLEFRASVNAARFWEFTPVARANVVAKCDVTVDGSCSAEGDVPKASLKSEKYPEFNNLVVYLNEARPGQAFRQVCGWTIPRKYVTVPNLGRATVKFVMNTNCDFVE